MQRKENVDTHFEAFVTDDYLRPNSFKNFILADLWVSEDNFALGFLPFLALYPIAAL